MRCIMVKAVPGHSGGAPHRVLPRRGASPLTGAQSVGPVRMAKSSNTSYCYEEHTSFIWRK